MERMRGKGSSATQTHGQDVSGGKIRDQRRSTREHVTAANKNNLNGIALLASPRKRVLVGCFFLVMVTFLVYSPVFEHPFIFNYDDDCYVLNNSHVQAGLTWATLTWALKSTECSNWHPLTWLSHALDGELYGLNPGGHHVTNVLLHALNVVLLFLLLVRATGLAGRSFLVAALFALHPLNVESVAWVAERKNVLSTSFFLLTLGVYGWYAMKPSIERYVAVAALFVFGLAAKPIAITLPCVLVLLDFWPLQRIQGWGQSSPQLAGNKDHETLQKHVIPWGGLPVPQASFSRLILEKLPLLVLCVFDGIVTIFAQRSYGSMHLVIPFAVRLENAVYAYAMYVWKGFWPSGLAVFYPHPGSSLTLWQLGLATLFLFALSLLVWRDRFDRPYLVTGWLWFLGVLVPVIGIIQVGEQAMADRYAYIPMMGIFLMVVFGVAEWADRRQLSSPSRVKIAAVPLIIFLLFTREQIGYWDSSIDLWSRAVHVTKDNFFAEENLSSALMMIDRSEEALPHLQNAVRIRPTDSHGHLNLAADLALSSHPREAISEYETAISLGADPKTLAGVYQTLGMLHGQLGDYSEARSSYQQSLRIDSQQEGAKNALNEIDLSEAMRNVTESPSGQSYLRLGQLLEQRGRLSEARGIYQQALKLDPKLAAAQQALRALNVSENGSTDPIGNSKDE